MTRLLAACEVQGTTSWSTVAWIDHSVDRWTDNINADSWCFVCTRGKIVKIRFERGLQSTSPRFPKVWMLITSFTLWYVWKARCLKVFQDLVRPLEEVTMDIWFALISAAAYEGNWTRFAATPTTCSLPGCAFGRNGGTRTW